MTEIEKKNPLEQLFSEPDTVLFLHSKHPNRIAYVIQGLQRILGKQNVSFQRPWLNKKTRMWTLKIVLHIPEILLKHQRDAEEQ